MAGKTGKVAFSEYHFTFDRVSGLALTILARLANFLRRKLLRHLFDRQHTTGCLQRLRQQFYIVAVTPIVRHVSLHDLPTGDGHFFGYFAGGQFVGKGLCALLTG